MTLDEVQPVLEAAGFVPQSGATFDEARSRSFIRPSSGLWKIGAYADVDDRYGGGPRVDIGLKLDPRGASIGTVHRILSLRALHARIQEILTTLEALAQQEQLLKCPKCGTRWVAIKEPSAGGKQFSPFLSCQGMHRARGRMGKYTPCDGVSTQIPALLVHR